MGSALTVYSSPKNRFNFIMDCGGVRSGYAFGGLVLPGMHHNRFSLLNTNCAPPITKELAGVPCTPFTFLSFHPHVHIDT